MCENKTLSGIEVFANLGRLVEKQWIDGNSRNPKFIPVADVSPATPEPGASQRHERIPMMQSEFAASSDDNAAP